ncbi:hypothetical protein GCM10023310_69300 [Paenibacillus vulneris]|uniref:Uncharacterized protein n=1 Tax=Paenibacillus vulneris TaxID=1133364 RepID=A0ABW3UIE4_9BACL
MNSLDSKVTFCSGCFATNEDGSWGINGWSVSQVKEYGLGCYCLNCGGHGEIVIISRRAANRIRESASWVGKRYYPIEEDFVHSFVVNGDEGTYTVKWRLELGVKTAPEGIRTVNGVNVVEAEDILNKALSLFDCCRIRMK